MSTNRRVSSASRAAALEAAGRRGRADTRLHG